MKRKIIILVTAVAVICSCTIVSISASVQKKEVKTSSNAIVQTYTSPISDKNIFTVHEKQEEAKNKKNLDNKYIRTDKQYGQIVREYVESLYGIVECKIVQYDCGPQESEMFLISVARDCTSKLTSAKTVSASIKVNAELGVNLAFIVN